MNEVQQLRDTEGLIRLMEHYTSAGAADRPAWQDRLMELEGLKPAELARLHGALIAHGWVEQNTRQTPFLKPGVVACCYRVTGAGVRALRLAKAEGAVDEDLEAAALGNGIEASTEGVNTAPPTRRPSKLARAEKASASQN
jgi:hypothetical protein